MYLFLLNALNQISLGKAYLHVLALLCKLYPVLLLLLCFQYVLTFFAIIITSASRNYLINNILKSSLRFFSSVLTFQCANLLSFYINLRQFIWFLFQNLLELILKKNVNFNKKEICFISFHNIAIVLPRCTLWAIRRSIVSSTASLQKRIQGYVKHL